MLARIIFKEEITPEGLIDVYNALGVELKGKVAVKIHSGEEGNQNFIKPELLKPLIDYVHGTVVECNTAYKGARTNTKDHMELMHKHGWDKYFNIDIMDSEGDIELPIPNGKVLKKTYVGKHINNYDSMLVISHFKGHPMGGYGGALKQLSIGCASRGGKAYIHSAGKTTDADTVWNDLPDQDKFLESMADAASAVYEHFKGHIVFINIMKDMSVDCDCCAVAEDPCLQDFGVLSSENPVAIDQACLDLIDESEDKGRDHFLDRVESKHGIHTIEAANELGIGNRDYEFFEI